LKQFILSFNPHFTSWIRTEFFMSDGFTLQPEYRSTTYALHTTYKDNAFLGEDFEGKLEKRKKDMSVYNRDALGLWQQIKGLIYPDWTFDATSMPETGTKCYGGDFGYNDPTTCIDVRFYEGAIYLDQKFYQSELDPNQLNAVAEKHIEDKRRPEYWDNARPELIAGLRKAGFNALPCDKTKKYEAIMTLKGYPVYVTSSSVDIIREAQSYKWREDKYGNTFDEPVDFDDHTMDGGLYGFRGLYPAISRRHADWQPGPVESIFQEGGW